MKFDFKDFIFVVFCCEVTKGKIDTNQCDIGTAYGTQELITSSELGWHIA